MQATYFADVNTDLRVLRRSQVAHLLRVSPATFDRMRKSGAFPVEPINWPGHPRWSRKAIVEWLGGDETTTDDECALLSLAEVAGLMNTSRSTAYRRAAGLPAVKASDCGDRRYPRIAVCHLLSSASSPARSRLPAAAARLAVQDTAR
jgi:predicted DNA-binding transcriptional regulator AlpA